ncbi:MAG: hypothetical protein GC166_02410 [Alphaproteobacteria bacterium]|nr:hypothetical protein [Alphaproteobacteria bacterium]
MVTRRAAIGGGAAALVLAGFGYRAFDRGVFSSGAGVAFAPWEDWQGTASDGVRRPLHAGILAANPHDTQPWAFTAERDTITVIADRARNLGSFDPFRREMHLGLGCAVENIEIAASAFGYSADVTPKLGTLSLSPPDDPVVAAEIILTKADVKASPLFDFIPKRHTNRGAYKPDAIPGATLSAFSDLVAGTLVRVVFFSGHGPRDALGELMIRATEEIIADPQMSKDSARWFRTGRGDIAEHRDGVTMDTSGLSPLMRVMAKLAPDVDAATADQGWLTMTRDLHVGTAPVLGMILVRDRLDMEQAIAAGRAWQRLHLAATREGLAAQPINQPVEMIDRNAMMNRKDIYMKELVRLADAQGWQPTFTFRMGYAQNKALPSPRRPLSEVLQS